MTTMKKKWQQEVDICEVVLYFYASFSRYIYNRKYLAKCLNLRYKTTIGKHGNSERQTEKLDQTRVMYK